MAQNAVHPDREAALNVVNVIVGLCLVLSPWAFGYSHVGFAAANAWAGGAVIAAVAVGALVAYAEWEQWANFVLGLWMIISPWMLAFTAVRDASYVAVLAGVVVAALAAMELWFVRHRPMSTA